MFHGPILLAVFLLLFLLVGLYLVYESQGLFRDVLAMVLTPTIDVSDVYEGRVEVTGTATVADETLTDPVSGEDAVAFEYTVSKEEAFKDDLLDHSRAGYRHETDGTEAVPFYVDGGATRVLVDPGDPDAEGSSARDGVANVYATRTDSVHVTDEDDAPGWYERFLDRQDLPETDRNREIETARIEPGDEVYVLGTATMRDGRRAIGGVDDRFVVANASQLRTLVYNAGWGIFKFCTGVVLAIGCGYLLFHIWGPI